MSLLKKASIITTPTAYAEDYLYSIKPAYALGSELVTNGDFATDSDWVKSSGSTISNGSAHIVSDGNYEFIYQVSVLTIGRKYRVEYEIVENNSGSLKMQSSFSLSPIASTVGVHSFDAVAGSSTLYIERQTPCNIKITNISVKEITDADFDFDRNSTGTRVNEDYLIEDVPYNLVSNSENFSVFTKVNATVTTNQTLAPDGTLTADKIVFNGTANARVEQNLTASIMGTPNTQSVFLKTESGTANIDIGLATHDVTTVAVTSEWKRFTHTGEGSYPRMKSDSAVTIFAWGMQVVKGDQPKDYLKTTDRLDIPRIDYTNGEPSILLEPSRTNLVTYSQDLTQGWGGYTFSGGSISVTYGFLSPESLNNATRIAYTNSSAGSGGALWTTNITLVASTQYTISFYAKRVSGTKQIRVDLRNSSSAGVSGSVFTLTDKWERYSTTVTNDSATSRGVQIRIIDSEYAGNRTFDIYGFQLEAGSYATSLIHTSGSAVTRSADAANNAGNSDLFNDSEGVLYVEMKGFENDAISRPISISDGDTSDRINLFFPSNQTNVTARVTSGGADQFNATYTSINQTVYNKLALKYKANDFALWLNGVEILTDSSGLAPNGLKVLAFNNASGTVFRGNVKSVMVFKEALTDLELEKLTGYNNHELYMNYYNRLSYLGLAEEYNVESDINNYIL